jgi:ubiquinone/menaquinone biosynthesis C-methylase UbiE
MREPVATQATAGENAVRHPIFARVYGRWAEIAERRGAAEHRQRMLAGLAGRVIEVGAGHGANFPFYPSTVSQVVAVEPEQYLRERALTAASDASVPITVVNGVGGQLPGDDQSFDAGVAALVLCTIPDPHQALHELFRVIRPGGELHFYEHVVAHAKWEARFQRLADATLWPRIAGGCHLARDTETNIRQAGFEVDTCERFPFSPMPLFPPDPMILGVARRP